MRSSDILIVDDEIGIRDLLSEILQDEGYTVTLAENAEEARQLRHQTRPSMVLLDIWMPDCDGITLLKEWAKNGQLNMPVVMMSGHASIDTAVEATKIGALDFLEKPIALQKLLSTVERALKYSEMQAASGLSLDKLGNSPVIQELNRTLEAAAKQNKPVLLVGETGSPFKLVARYFQKNGTPWVEPGKTEYIVDTPLELLQKASGGVLYLDDISQYSKNIQQGISFLLSKADRYNTRIICASSRTTAELAENPAQDSKLLDIISGLTVNIPPLRSQPDDIVFLVNQILTELAETQKIPMVKFSTAALNILRQYDWPGNLDQLHSVIKNLTLTAENDEVSDHAVNIALGQLNPGPSSEMVGGFNFNMPLRELREELERRYFEYHIAQEGQNMSRVAQKVGLERTHLYRKLKQLGIQFSRRSKNDPE
ncbi:sigma-54-dependent transcriptional regulator [Neisseria weaveri]|uniref:Nitrogen assimilation regulatory protein NtrX n=1 Tax=Neisseria weaveri TaxID=28091 RepID=A0A448VNQ3_9NEIS|nr:sigma-54 dependent transcriptional regulator [Neisseria weaveri]EGV35090.1 DNA-binding response regulator, Fis family [Neisseria weaveri LMG 5135]EGV36241.1 DNA-binding response regulator, Fis family [Neisseria weaveri ATCC 51223]SAY51964.1 nitrogen assimilation regulatory protein NtrX [Neisseria weaveri]VEJ51381.1 nitrogen assimilation regulatory protein NtrX [Neisseria weaveri]